jgi:hypothetical protein
MSNHTLPPVHLRWWHCDHEGEGLEGCPICRKVPDKLARLGVAGLLRAIDRENLALVGQVATERDDLRVRLAAAETERNNLRARVMIAEGIRDRTSQLRADLDAWHTFSSNVAVAVYPRGYDELVEFLHGTESLPDILWDVRHVVEARDAAVARAEKAEAALKHADALLSDGLGIVEDLTAGHDVWAGQVRSHLYPGQETSQ